MGDLTAFDILVLVILAGGAMRGVMRGFVAEIIALGALIAGLFALRLFHTPFSLWLSEAVGTESGAAMLAFVILVGGIWGAGKALGARLGAATRKSAVIGPVDRLLEALWPAEGLLVASMAYMLFTLGYDVVFGATRTATGMAARKPHLSADAGDRLRPVRGHRRPHWRARRGRRA